jgi:DNA-binding LacI/PurR family transcriptional regulator
MFDVAQASGVSHQTVSRVLNNHESVSDKTRAKVLASMEKLGYRPNLAARALVTGKSSTIGVLSYDTTLFGPASMLHAIRESARELGYALNTLTLKSIDRESVENGIQELINAGVDGLVIIAPHYVGDKPFSNIPGSVPTVIVESEDTGKIPSVNVDQILGAQLAVEHLISLGHKRIAHISGPENWFETQKRIEGWKCALEKSKLSTKPLVAGDWSARSGYEATKEILKDPKVTAIFAANDSMALGALKALSEAKVAVPAKMSLIGFDNLPESEFLVPELTTVVQDFQEVGKRSLDLLIAQIEGKKIATKRLDITPTLAIRASTAKAPH